jgi:hypothetical protein
LALGNTIVDRIRRSESVDQDLEVGKSLAVARLNSWAIAVRIDIENGNRTQNRVSVKTSSAVVDIDVGDNVFAVPETLKEAEHLWGLITADAGHAEVFRKLSALDQ